MKQLQINTPEGYEIDQDKSDLSKGIVHFKKCKKTLNYSDVAKELFKNEKTYFTCADGKIEYHILSQNSQCIEPNNSTTKEQLESILVLNKLCNVAKYLNTGWLPDFSNIFNKKTMYHIYINGNDNIDTWRTDGNDFNNGLVYFKTENVARKAIEILGEDEIRKALTLNH